MTNRLESRLARLEKRKQAERGGLTVLVVEENFYGNAHFLARMAEVGDEVLVSDVNTTLKPGGDDDTEIV